MLDDAELLKQCEIEFGRASGPGGQHRNKVETAVTITHRPTGVSGSATERRHQSQNRHEALFRLRLHLANRVRREIDPVNYQPSDLWRTRRQGEKMSVSPTHRDYPALLAEALDVVVARNFDVAGSAGMLGITMSQLGKLLRHNKEAHGHVNRERERRGLHALK
jgi:hypothetical protein